VAPPTLLDVTDLGEWSAAWDRLVDASPLPSPFLRSWWLSGTGGAGRHFLLVIDETQLIGGLALEQHHPLSGIRVMGDGPLCPDHVDLVAAPGQEAAVVGVLRKWLCRPGSRLFDLRGVRAGSPLAETLPGRVRREPIAAAPFALLPESAEAFRVTLPAQFRRNLRKSGTRLADEGVQHRMIRGQAVLASLDTLRELHRAQWEGRSQFLPVFDRFVAGCTGGIAVDEVVVHELATDDLVVAIVLAFEVAGRVSLYQSARRTDPRWRDVTTALLAAIIDDACGRGCTEVDFLRGEESYKGRFTTTQREMYRLVAAKGVAGQLGRMSTMARFHATQAAVRGIRYGRSVTARGKS
jgi:CelD/BcsL family acetyltransferase involved in cellulose biosynthesis